MSTPDDSSANGLSAAARNPRTDAVTLREIAYHYPHLRPLVAAHPNAYPGLCEWLATLGDPAVDAALAQRATQQEGPAASPQDARTGSSATPPTISADNDTDATRIVQRVSLMPHKRPATEEEGAIPSWSAASAAGKGHHADGPAAGLPLVPSSAPTLPTTPAPVPSFPEPTHVLPSLPEPTHVPSPVSASSSIPQVFPPVSGRSATSSGWDSLVSRDASTQGKNVDHEPQKTSKLFVVVLLLLVIAVALVTLVVLVFTGVIGGSPQPADTQAPSASQQQSAPAPLPQTDSEQSTPEEEKPIEYYAPVGALETTSFVTPSGNIHCSEQAGEGDKKTLLCRITSNNWAAAGMSACPNGQSHIALDQERAELSCPQGATSAGANPPVLDYGRYATVGDYACYSTRDGLTCWNMRSGISFAMARGGWMTSTGGQITPDRFSW